jgi:hypothetical protein
MSIGKPRVDAVAETKHETEPAEKLGLITIEKQTNGSIKQTKTEADSGTWKLEAESQTAESNKQKSRCVW